MKLVLILLKLVVELLSCEVCLCHISLLKLTKPIIGLIKRYLCQYLAYCLQPVRSTKEREPSQMISRSVDY